MPNITFDAYLSRKNSSQTPPSTQGKTSKLNHSGILNYMGGELDIRDLLHNSKEQEEKRSTKFGIWRYLITF